MKKCNYIAIVIAVFLFAVPFFWLKPGFIDLGGDSGRLYFIDPSASALYKYANQTMTGASIYAFIPYELLLALLHKLISSPTYLIAVDRGIVLSIGFFSMYLIVNQLYLLFGRHKDRWMEWAAITAGIVYIGFIANSGWKLSLETYYQMFLNPLIFYLLLRFVLTSRFRYAFGILFVTFIYAGNFGYSSAPQFFSFFPFAIIFILVVNRFICHRPTPWRNLLGITLLFIGIHSFHLVPMLASLLNRGSYFNTYIFSNQSIQNSGVNYFDFNHEVLGKISTQLFQPSQWHSQTLFALLPPVVILLGLISGPSRLLAVTASFFMITFFLVSANITKIGIVLYRALFYIPGFMMFRSFDERWYYAFAFFYTTLFALSLYSITKDRKLWLTAVLVLFVVGSTAYRIYPFFQGKAIDGPLYQSNNVSPVFQMDTNLTDALSFVKKLPKDGKFLTLPLTFPNYQIAYGKAGGAYVGVSMISTLTGHKDYPGFWTFGKDEQAVFDALQRNNMVAFVAILRRLHVTYIFRNSDPRIMEDFPGYPYVYPGMIYSAKDQLPAIKNQASYDSLIASLPVKKIYEKGFYSIYEFPEWLAYPSETIDPALQKYFIAGRLICGATIIIAFIVWYAVRKKYEK